MFQRCSEKIEYVTWNMDDFVRRNGQLSAPMLRHPNRGLFASLYASEGFKKAVDVALHDDIRRIKRNLWVGRISRAVYLIPGMRKLYKTLKI